MDPATKECSLELGYKTWFQIKIMQNVVETMEKNSWGAHVMVIPGRGSSGWAGKAVDWEG